ncbi:thiol-activated cytolysin family protein [Psychroserpens mesophilus]|uniref:thiol-activated cytolysin family protein n=1 Tax=Psychroserpens mesophilus TaxID=325473 RepID=UPI003D6554DF
MKHLKPHIMKLYLKFVLLFAFALVAFNCSKSDDGINDVDENPFASSINEYILGLNYNPESLLNTQSISGSIERTEIDSQSLGDDNPVQGVVTSCVRKTFDLKSNFSEVSILQPTSGIIYPGALIYGDNNMLDGLPNPITSVSRGPATFRIGLPGFGDQGTVVVNNLENSSVDSSISNALEWWHDNAYPNGYENLSQTSYKSATSYSRKQLGLEVGLNVEWASGSIESQLEYQSTETNKVAMLVYKQVFYTVTMDNPFSPASVFGNDVTLEQVQSVIDDNRPPAYVKSVSYGRIIMFRMETSDVETEVDLSLALQYASGISGGGTTNSAYEEVLNEATITVVTLGGNAQAAAEIFSPEDENEGITFGSFGSILSGTNAVFTRNNPGIPMAYTIRYLKDNSLAKMGFQEEYTADSCGENEFEHERIKVINDFTTKNIRVRLTYQTSNGTISTDWVTITDEDQDFFEPPAGSWNVEVEIEYFNFGWNGLVSQTLGHVEIEQCYRTYNPSGWENASYDYDCDSQL